MKKKNKNPFIKVGSRKIGADYKPFVIVEIGINHNGDFKKAKNNKNHSLHIIIDEAAIIAIIKDV